MNEKERKDLITYRLNRASETLEEVQLLSENRSWNGAINRLYYSCFYAVSALLMSIDIHVNTHAGVRKMFGLHFIKTGILSRNSGKLFSELFEMRSSGDYDDFIEYGEEEVLAVLEPAQILIREIQDYLQGAD